MKFDRQMLLDKLAIIKLATVTHDFIPILSSFCFDTATVLAYNDVFAIRSKLSMRGYRVALKAQTVLQFLSGLKGEEVIFEQDEQAVFMQVKTCSIRVPFMKEDAFICKWPDTKKLDAIELSGKRMGKFVEGVRLCLVSADENPQHVQQQGLTMNVHDGKLTIYSTNNTTVSRYTMKWEGEELEYIVLPTSFCRAFLSAWDAAPPDSLTLRFGKDFLTVEVGQFEMYSKMIPNPQPWDFEKVFEAHLENLDEEQMVPVTEHLRECMHRCRLVLDSDINRWALVRVNSTKVAIESTGAAGAMTEHTLLSKQMGKSDFWVDPFVLYAGLVVADKVLFCARAVALAKDNFLQLVSIKKKKPTEDKE